MSHLLSVPKTTLACPRSLQGPNDSFRPDRLISWTCRAVASSSTSGGDDRFKVEYTPWLIVGLGNPGNRYQGTRHNVGFEMIDRIAQAEGVSLNTIQSKALIGIGCIGEVPIVLAKPQVYMNFCGESVSPLAFYYQVPLRHIMVIYDEMQLPNGVLRLQPKGGDGKHSGLKSVMAHLDQRREFPRLSIGRHLIIALPFAVPPMISAIASGAFQRIVNHGHVIAGIGSPPGSMEMKAFLLQKFSLVEREQIDEALSQGVEAVRTVALKGFSPIISRFNVSQKYKYHKV